MAALPDGYRYLAVEVSEAEFKRLKSESATLGAGTVSAAIRTRAGMGERPYGLVTAEKRATTNTGSGTTA